MKVRILAIAMLAVSVVLSACDTGTAANPTATTAPAVAATATTATTAPTATGAAPASGRAVVVSSKDFTEEVIIGEMYAQALENAGIKVERKLNLGTTDIAQAALLKGGPNGGIDLYPEYTSTGLIAVLKATPINDPQQAYDAVKKGYEDKFKLTWLDKTPMNDTQAIVTSKDVSDQQGIKTLDDLCAKASNLTIAARAEFKTRADALPALQKIYGGCNFKDIKVVESSLLYKAVVDKQVDVAQADGTAGEIAGYSLVLLADPKHYGPPDNVAPVVRDDVLAMYPQMADTLNKVDAKITDQEISALNWDVAGNKKEPADVVKAWLAKQGLTK
jgi:osmoprotectant transport system substrate-binding protein